jgi:PAS domain-containing protein
VSATERAVRLVSLPTSDHAFAEQVAAIFEAEPPASPQAFEARLRLTYPRARVRPRDLVGEGEVAWYVFRESPYTVPGDADWWRLPTSPHVAVTFTGVAVEANEPLLQLLGTTREQLVGAHYERFVPPDTRGDAARLLAIVLRRGQGASLVTLQRADGTRIEVAWHAEVRGLRLHAWFRPVQEGS